MNTSDPNQLETLDHLTPEPQPSGSLPMALLGGVLAAAAAGVVWGLIVFYTRTEIGYAAVGVGFLAGLAVVFFGKGRGIPFQIVASACAVLGIAIGKYATFFNFAKAGIEEESGAEAAAALSMFAPETFQFFREVLPKMVDGFDILWVILAVSTAWGMPKEQ